MDERTRAPMTPENSADGAHPDPSGRKKWPMVLGEPVREPPRPPAEPEPVAPPESPEPEEDVILFTPAPKEEAPSPDEASAPEDEPAPEEEPVPEELPEEPPREETAEAELPAEQPTMPMPPVEKPAEPAKRSSGGKKKSAGRGKKSGKKTRKKPEPEPDPWEEERIYRPIRSRRDGRIGCLGGIMYALFIISASIVLAAFAWMSAADVLALNKPAGTVEVTLPESAFTQKEVEVKDDDGVVTGTRTITAARIGDVASVLKDHGLINYKWLFSLYSQFSHADEQLDPGTYVLSTNLDYRALVKKMQAGADSQLQTLVMFPEGFNMDQIFARLEEKGVCSREDLYAAAANTEFSYAFLEGAETGDPYRLEGFLFPDTYYFYQGMQASSAINRFLSNLHYLVTDEMWQQTRARGLTFHEMITIASYIEREAANDEERPLIASVIYNRLNAGMPLQLDSTVSYALRDEDVKLSTEIILSTDSPYNTYLYAGLTPGPICNPGMSSIQAALNPSATYYLFYALDTATGTHRFFTNLDDHEAFVATQDYG